MFLYSLMAEGGLPEALLKHEGLYRRVVLGMLKDIEAEGGTRAAPFAERIAERWVAVLPQTFRTEEFAHLLAEFVLALVALREQLPDDLPEQAADRWLDINRPGWKAALPVRLSEGVLNELIRPALCSQRGGIGVVGGPLATRELQRDDAGVWHSVLRVAEGGFLSEMLLPDASGLRLRLQPSGAAANAAGPMLVYTATPDSGGWHLRRFGRSGIATMELPPDVPFMLAAFADGRPVGEVAIAPGMPLLADAASLWRAADPNDGEAARRLIPQPGSGRARAACLWLLVAESAMPEASNGVAIEAAGALAGGRLWRISGQGTLRLGARTLCIETSAKTELPEAHLIAVGEILPRWRTARDKGLVHRGPPRLFGEIGAAGLKPLPERDLQVTPSSGPVLGAQVAEWVERNEVRARLHFLCLPPDARLSAIEEEAGRVRLEASGLPEGLRLMLRAGSAQQSVELSAGAGQVTLSVAGSPPGELTARLSNPSTGTALELIAPWPARAGLVLDPNGHRLERDAPLAVEELLGWRALVPENASGDLELRLDRCRPLALPVTGEVPLYPYVGVIRAMLAQGGPDAQVNLQLIVAGRGGHRLEIRRYHEHAVVEGDRLRTGLQRDTRPPPENAFSAQLDRRPITIHAVALNAPDKPRTFENMAGRDLRALLGAAGGLWLIQSRIEGRAQRAVAWSPSPRQRSDRDERMADYARMWERLIETPGDPAWERNWALISSLAQGGDAGFADQVQAIARVPAAAMALVLRVPLAALAEALALNMATPIFWPTVSVADVTVAIQVELRRGESRYATLLDPAEAVAESRSQLVGRIADILLLQPALAGHFAASLVQADLLTLAVALNARGPIRLWVADPEAELRKHAQEAAKRFDRLPSGVGRIAPRAPLTGLAFNRYAQPVIDAPLVAAELALRQRGPASPSELLDLINLRLVDSSYFDAALPVAVARASTKANQ